MPRCGAAIRKGRCHEKGGAAIGKGRCHRKRALAKRKYHLSWQSLLRAAPFLHGIAIFPMAANSFWIAAPFFLGNAPFSWHRPNNRAGNATTSKTAFWSGGCVDWSSGGGAPPFPDEVAGATRPRNEHRDKYAPETREYWKTHKTKENDSLGYKRSRVAMLLHCYSGICDLTHGHCDVVT